ncbi:MAG: hypothetical protein ACLQU5_29295 [Isosphaeraceae bacterium]
MFERLHSSRRRDLRPSLDSLEERALLSAGLPHHVHEVRVSADVIAAKHDSNQPQASSPSITILNSVSSRGYRFTNFDGPNAGNLAGTGTMMNGIANSTTVAGFTIANDGKTLTNFTANPPETTKARLVNINGSTTAMALGINSTGTVVGTDGHGNAFSLNRHGVLRTFIPNGGSSAVALGINDRVNIVGQFVTSTATPGFVLVHGGTSFLTINAPSGPNTVFAQGVNNADLVVGFYVGTDRQDHGFIARKSAVAKGTLTAVADPTIPAVPGEPGATFVFSQILGINDFGIAVGYYGDSTGSQHGFIYNTHTGKYTFLDDPNAAFNNGVEVTQITGISNSGEITGFYSDANGVFHGFVATTHAA